MSSRTARRWAWWPEREDLEYLGADADRAWRAAVKAAVLEERVGPRRLVKRVGLFSTLEKRGIGTF